MIALGPSGFYKTPVMKGIMLTVGASSMISSMLSVKQYFPLQLTSLTQHLQLYRLVIHHFVFANTGEMLFGIIILYYFRLFERQYGSAKFVSFAFTTAILSTMAQIGILVLGRSFGLTYASSGPYGLIFALLIPYFNNIPTLTGVSIYGLTLSSKHLTYLLCLQLAWMQSPGSLISAVAGLTAGFLHHSIGSIQRWMFPKMIRDFCSKYISPILSSSPPSFNISPPSNFQNLTRRNPPNQTPEIVEPPSEENIELLIGMGFTRENVVRALTQTRNNVQRATNLLIDQSS